MFARLWNNFYFLIIVTMLIWGATASVAAFLFQQGLTPEEVATMDIIMAFAAMLGLSLAFPASRASYRRYHWRQIPKLVLLSLLGICLYNYLLFKAYGSDPENVPPYAIVNYMWPLTTILFGVLILREKPTVYTWISGVVGFLGFLLIQFGKAFAAEGVQAAWSGGDLGGTAVEIVRAERPVPRSSWRKHGKSPRRSPYPTPGSRRRPRFHRRRRKIFRIKRGFGPIGSLARFRRSPTPCSSQWRPIRWSGSGPRSTRWLLNAGLPEFR